MNKFVAAYVAAALVMLALDMLWLGVIAKGTYQQGIGHLMADKPNIPVAAIFYALYAAGVVIFVLVPQADGATWRTTLLMGALLGFFAYATYDLSNLATLRDWPVSLTLIDLVWGSFLTAAVAGAGKAAMDWAVSS
jgi:uncharacterized membrane protein